MSTTLTPRRSRLIAATAAGLLALVGSVAASTPALADDDECGTSTELELDDLLECVSAGGTMQHLKAFQAIADANGSSRAAGTSGYAASVDYVEQRLEKVGYDVTRQAFSFPQYTLLAEPTLSGPRAFTYGVDFRDMSYSGSGNVTARASQVTGPTGLKTGCAMGEFAGFPAGDIAVISRGTCSFAQKAANAQAAGAVGVVIYNNIAGLLNGTLSNPGITIPVIGTTPEVGPELVGQQVSFSVQAVSRITTTENVFAELPGRTSDNVVMAGAHLDSVAAGPGINDNGSGSAGILEVAENIASTRPENTVRFAWWGAEELGLRGSNHYVGALTQAQRDDIALYLNFDMIGSPNFARFIYDGDQSDFTAPVPVPAGSAQIEGIFERFYDSERLTYEGTEFSGRSDYQAFINNGIPAGGLFTGAEGIKSAAQAARYGGTAGTAFDPCYHQACDGIANVDKKVLGQNADAVAYSVFSLAYSTAEVNGVVGQPVPGADDDDDDDDRRSYRSDAEGDAGGGLHADHDHEGHLATS